LVRQGALDTVKIGDFGLCDLFSATGGQRLDGLGTEYILPPEAFDDNASLGPHFDVWALGVLLFTLLSGRLPFGKSGYNLGGEEESHVPEAAVTKSKIKAGVYKLPTSVDPLAADLLRWMLAMKPGDRASVTQVLNHPWTTDMESSGNACMCPLPALPNSAEVGGGPRRMSRGGSSSMQSEQSPSKTTSTTGPSTATATAVSEKSRVASVGLDALDRSIHEYSPRPGLDRSVHGQHQTTSSRRLSVGKDSLDQSIHEHAIDRTSNSSSTTIATTTVGDGGAGAAAALVTGKLRRKASTVDAMEVRVHVDETLFPLPRPLLPCCSPCSTDPIYLIRRRRKTCSNVWPTQP
jgi:serine/threonine protein kinase